MSSGDDTRKSGPPTLRLSARDLKILSHIARFRLTTFDVLHRLFFAGQKRDAVKSTLRRLCGRGPTYRLLRPEPLDGQRIVYRLTRRGAHHVGAPPDIARPLGPQARVEHLAVLRFIHAEDNVGRSLIPGKRLREDFHLEGYGLPRQRFYIEEREGHLHLGVLVVDHGAHARRIVRKTVSVLARFLRRGWFDEYLRSGQFMLTVLTPTAGKERALGIGLKRSLREILGRPLAALTPPAANGWPLPVAIIVIPGLLSLLPGRNYQDERSQP